MEQTIAPVPDAAQRSPSGPAHLSLLAPSPEQQAEMIKPPSPISKPQRRATKQKKKKSFKALEDADSDYEYDNRDDDLSDLSDLEPLSPAGRRMRKRGRSVSPPPTVTVEEPLRTKRRLVYTFLCSDIPRCFSPPVFPNVEGHRSSESGCRYGACPPVPAGRSFGFDTPRSEVPSCSEEGL